LRALGGELVVGWCGIPDHFDRYAAARDVLESAGARGRITLPDGRRLLAFGWPDLSRPNSKVLVIGDGTPVPEIVALHRHPRRTGLCAEGGTLLPDASEDGDVHAEHLTGRVTPHGGELYAVDAASVHVLRDRHVWRWDGRRETDEGTPAQALASLLLQWSQR
jgi:hypothetical protein